MPGITLPFILLAGCNPEPVESGETGIAVDDDTGPYDGDTGTDDGDTGTETYEPVDLAAAAAAFGSRDLATEADVLSAANQASPIMLADLIRELLGATLSRAAPGASCPTTTEPETSAIPAEEGETLRHALHMVGNGCVDAAGVRWEGVIEGAEFIDENGTQRSAVRYTEVALHDTSADCGDGSEPLLALAHGDFHVGVLAGEWTYGSAGLASLPVDAGACGGETLDLVVDAEAFMGFERITTLGILASDQQGALEVDLSAARTDACVPEPAAGQQVLTTTDHEVVITFDGLSSCDEPPAVPWTLDGVDQGLLEFEVGWF